MGFNFGAFAGGFSQGFISSYEKTEKLRLQREKQEAEEKAAIAERKLKAEELIREGKKVTAEYQTKSSKLAIDKAKALSDGDLGLANTISDEAIKQHQTSNAHIQTLDPSSGIEFNPNLMSKYSVYTDDNGISFVGSEENVGQVRGLIEKEKADFAKLKEANPDAKLESRFFRGDDGGLYAKNIDQGKYIEGSATKLLDGYKTKDEEEKENSTDQSRYIDDFVIENKNNPKYKGFSEARLRMEGSKAYANRKASDSAKSFKIIHYTEFNDNGEPIGTRDATTQEEADALDKDDRFKRGTLYRPQQPQFEKDKEKRKDIAKSQAKAIEIGRSMNKGSFDSSKYSLEQLVEYENDAIERLSSKEKETLATDENYQLLATELRNYKDKVTKLFEDGKLKTGLDKTTIAKIGQYIPKLGEFLGMSIDDIKTTLNLVGEGASANAELIKIISGLAATDKEFERQFSANFGSWFSNPEMLVSKVTSTSALLDSRVKARQAKWRNKGIVQRFEPKANTITREDVSKMTKEERREYLFRNLKGL